MIFSELVLFGVALVGLIRLLRPLEHGLERALRRVLARQRHDSPLPIIDISDNTKDRHHDAS